MSISRYFFACALTLALALCLANPAPAQTQIIPVPELGMNGAQLQKTVPYDLKAYINGEEWQSYVAETELFGHPVKITYTLHYDSLVEIHWSWQIPMPTAVERQRLVDNAGLLVSATLDNPAAKLWQHTFDTSGAIAGSKPVAWLCHNCWVEPETQNTGFVSGTARVTDDVLKLDTYLVSGNKSEKPWEFFLKGTPDDSWMAGRDRENYPKTFMVAPWGSSPNTVIERETGVPDEEMAFMVPNYAFITFKRAGFGGWPITVTYVFEHDRLSAVMYSIQAKYLTMRESFDLTFAVENALLADIPVNGFYYKGARRKNVDAANYWRPYFATLSNEDNYIVLLSSVRSDGSMGMFNLDMRDRRNPQEAEWIADWEKSWSPDKTEEAEAE